MYKEIERCFKKRRAVSFTEWNVSLTEIRSIRFGMEVGSMEVIPVSSNNELRSSILEMSKLFVCFFCFLGYVVVVWLLLV
jgi:hypothetical protein